MKSKHPKLVLLGNNSGNNLGDAAIMSSIMDAVSSELPDAEFYVPSIKPEFINKNYGDKYNVKGIDVMPWTGSVRLFGIPTMYYMAKSDVALICDGIIFGKKLFNPLFNFLITLIFLVPWAKLTNCKLVCYCCGIGPFPTKISELCAKWTMNACDLITLREEDSIELAKKIGVTKELILTGDTAVINPVSSDERGTEILESLSLDPDAKYLGVNITRYIDSWLYDKDKKIDQKKSMVETIAEGVLQAKEKIGPECIPLVFSTQPMDDKISEQLASLLDAKVIGNSTWLSHDIQAVMKRCELFTGMRVHSLYLASAVDVPIVGMIYAPKVRSLMKQIKTPELGLELVDLSPETLADALTDAWNNRAEIGPKQKKIVDEIKYQAKRTAKLLVDRFYKESVNSTSLQKGSDSKSDALYT